MTAMTIPYPMASITAQAIGMDTAIVARGHASGNEWYIGDGCERRPVTPSHTLTWVVLCAIRNVSPNECSNSNYNNNNMKDEGR